MCDFDTIICSHIYYCFVFVRARYFGINLGGMVSTLPKKNDMG